MSSKIICLDVDGVLSNFYPGYNAICAALGKPILPVGRWDDFLDKEVWSVIRGSDNFWLNLPPLVEPEIFNRINDLRLGLRTRVYFVTNRVGIKVEDQTRDWLERKGIYRPAVIISKLKGDTAKSVGATHFIEDKAENAWCVAWLSPETKSYLLDRPYNQYDPSQFGSRKVKRVATIAEFLDIVEQGGI